MKYKLLKDLPYAKAGTIFNEDVKSDFIESIMDLIREYKEEN